jgi:hypothetical protein
VPAMTKDRDLKLEAYSETFYPEEQAKSTDKYTFAKNKIALRFNNKFKIVFSVNSKKLEIYDLENDPHELNNLYRVL